MGLDNIPRTYPCVKANTAVYTIAEMKNDDGSDHQMVDCEETQNRGACPYRTEGAKADLGEGVHGMFGTSCWYRGKYGEYLLQELGLDTNQWTFYGDGVEGDEGLSPEYCHDLANKMREALEELDTRHTYDKSKPKTLAEPFNGAITWPAEYEEDEKTLTEDRIVDIKYAAWWLDFVAEYADGSSIWY